MTKWVTDERCDAETIDIIQVSGCVVCFQYAQLNKFENVDTSAFCLTDQRFLFAVGNYRPCVFGVISVGFRLSFNLL